MSPEQMAEIMKAGKPKLRPMSSGFASQSISLYFSFVFFGMIGGMILGAIIAALIPPLSESEFRGAATMFACQLIVMLVIVFFNNNRLKLGMSMFKFRRKRLWTYVLVAVVAFSLATLLVIIDDFTRHRVEAVTSVSVIGQDIRLASPAEPISQSSNNSDSSTPYVLSIWEVYAYFFFMIASAAIGLGLGFTAVLLGLYRKARIHRGVAYLMFATFWALAREQTTNLVAGNPLIFLHDFSIAFLIGIVLAWATWKTENAIIPTAVALFSSLLLDDFFSLLSFFDIGQNLMAGAFFASSEFDAFLATLTTVLAVTGLFALIGGYKFVIRESVAMFKGLRDYGGKWWLISSGLMFFIFLVYDFVFEYMSSIFAYLLAFIISAFAFRAVLGGARQDENLLTFIFEEAESAQKETAERLKERPILPHPRQLTQIDGLLHNPWFQYLGTFLFGSISYLILAWVLTDFQSRSVSAGDFTLHVFIPPFLIGTGMALMHWVFTSVEFRPKGPKRKAFMIVLSGIGLFVGILRSIVALVYLDNPFIGLGLLCIPLILLASYRPLSLAETVELLYTLRNEWALRSLGRYNRDECIATLRNLALAERAPTRVQANIGLALLQHENASDLLRHAIEHTNFTREKSLYLVVLGMISYDTVETKGEMREFLRKFLFDDDPEIRSAAAHALSFAGENEDLRVLMNTYLMETTREVQQDIKTAIGRMDPKTVRQLV